MDQGFMLPIPVFSSSYQGNLHCRDPVLNSDKNNSRKQDSEARCHLGAIGSWKSSSLSISFGEHGCLAVPVFVVMQRRVKHVTSQESMRKLCPQPRLQSLCENSDGDWLRRDASLRLAFAPERRQVVYRKLLQVVGSTLPHTQRGDSTRKDKFEESMEEKQAIELRRNERRRGTRYSAPPWGRQGRGESVRKKCSIIAGYQT